MRPFLWVVVPLSLVTVIAAADPPAPPAEDAVAAALLGMVDARGRGDVAALRASIKLPLRTTWTANSGGDCTVPRSKSFTDPIKAASALSFDPRFVTVMRRDKGRTHRGTGCEEESSSTPFTHGAPAIVVTGEQATVHYETPQCGAGAPEYTFALTRSGGSWMVVGYDSGCHYDES